MSRTGERSGPLYVHAQSVAAPERHLIELPGVSRRSRRLMGPLDALVVDG